MTQHTYHILIIDDNPDDREVYRRFLERDEHNQYIFTETDSAERGVQLCQTIGPDCVLLDYCLPGRDGLEILQQWSVDQLQRSFAVVMLTGQGDEHIAVEAMKTGALDYLTKSKVSAATLQQAVHHAIAKVQRHREQAAHQAELERQATTDALTGLYNRRHLMDRLSQELQRAQRYHSGLSVLMIDVDHFKRINDKYGHLVGDQVLTQVGQILRGCLRGSDLAGRYGGEEFCVLAANTDLAGAVQFAERIRQMIAEHLFEVPEQEPFSVTCSIGVAEVDPQQRIATTALALADEALYQAKREGRNRVCVADSPSSLFCHPHTSADTRGNSQTYY